NLYKLEYLLRANLGGPKDLEKAQQDFARARKNLLAEGGGVVSTIYHPCEFVHKEFWDGVNFRNGANPPRERWQLPPTKTAAESRAAFDIFENYVRFMKRFPDVQFITATQAAQLYRDKARGRKFSTADIRTIAAAVKPEVSYQTHDDYALAASEVFALLNDYVAQRTCGANPDSLTLEDTPYGPSEPVAARAEAVKAGGSQMGRTAIDVVDFLRKQGRIPTSVWLGSQPVPPEMYLNALAK